MKPRFIRPLFLFSPLAVLLGSPQLGAAADAEAAARADAAVSSAQGEVAKAALRDLDVEIGRVEVLLDQAPTPEEKAAAKARLAVLKGRRDALHKTYVTSVYDKLKADVRAEYDQVAAWTRRALTRDPAEKTRDDIEDAARTAKRDARDAGDRAQAEAGASAAAADLARYKTWATDLNKSEAKTALDGLDHNLDRLADRIDNMPKGPDREVAKGRLDALKDRKKQLDREFVKARFDALIDDVRDEWGRFK